MQTTAPSPAAWTHILELNVAAALGRDRRAVGRGGVPDHQVGHGELLGWLSGVRAGDRVGVEGTGSYGAGLARFLRGAGIEVVEVDRPNRQARRRQGKSDPVDAMEAARAAQSGRASGRPRPETATSRRSGRWWWPSAAPARRRSSPSTRSATSASPPPTSCDERLKGCSRDHLAAEAAALRPRPGGDPVIMATKTALRTLGGGCWPSTRRKPRLDELLAELVAATAPALLGVHGVGVDTAATLLVTAGDNPDRLRSEAAWAHLCGVAPIEASSGKVTRYRLNRGGDRQANSALWGIVITRLRSDPRTQTYMQRRSKRAAPSPRSSASSSVTSPARSTATSHAA